MFVARICSRSPSSHLFASRHALPTARRRTWPSSPATGYEPRNFTCGLLRREVAEAVGDELVGDVAFEVDEEAVVAEALLGRPRLELGEVDRTRRELLQDREQRAGSVLRAGSTRSTSCRGPTAPGCRGRRSRSGSGSRGGPRCRERGSRARRASRPARLPIAAIPVRFDFATCCAASAVELATTGTASGRFLASQIRLWPSGFGCDTTVVMSASFVPGRAHRFSEIGRSTSRCTSSSVSNASVSSVTEIEPSIEFSIGTMPRSTSPRSTAVITCGHITERHRFTRGEVGLREERFLRERAAGPEEAHARLPGLRRHRRHGRGAYETMRRSLRAGIPGSRPFAPGEQLAALVAALRRPALRSCCSQSYRFGVRYYTLEEATAALTRCAREGGTDSCAHCQGACARAPA